MKANGDGVSTPTALLREQHQKILRVAGVLEEILLDEATSSRLDYGAIEDCVTFIRLYADALHHGKEEGLLFPELELVGLSREAGPLAVMLHEHRLGRTFAAAMAEALPAARAGDYTARRSLRGAAFGYIELIRGHILKEDRVLFDIADEMIDEPACRGLCSAYEEVCQRRFEGCTVAQLEAIFARLSAWSPAG